MRINYVPETFLLKTDSGLTGQLFDIAIIVISSFAIAVFIILFFISAPYGKFIRKGWGPVIRSKWAWMVMEFPSPALMVLFFINGTHSLPQMIFLSLWLIHYLHRTFIYPFSQSGREKPYPVVIVLMAFVFNCFNGFVNGYGVFSLYTYDITWLMSWQFILGIILFITGFAINKISDNNLRELRIKSGPDYLIPRGWLFDYISCPHYFGEIVEWGGWALLTWSLPGFAFFIFTFANLFPRAVSSHKWYKSRFPEYPSGRKAIIPFIL